MQILSATHIGTFKACPERYHKRYGQGIIPIEDTDSQRYGTSWHKIQEIVNLNPGDKCPDCKDKVDRRECPICGGHGFVDDGGMDAVIRYLNHAYATPPINKTPEDAEVERITLLYSLIGYNWYYGGGADSEGPLANSTQHMNVVAQELAFSLPLKSPFSQRKLPRVCVNGKIDKILSDSRGVFIKELKSTSNSVEPDSDYWRHLTLDTQTLLYMWAGRQLGYPDIQLLYDVWHRPQIRPKMLTQAESKSFVETGDYCGQKFEVRTEGDNTHEVAVINGTSAEIEPGKKEGTFALRETPEMFGARLLQDITERPTFYFCTKEIARTDADIQQFEKDLFNMYNTIRTMDKTNAWWCNENSCENKYKCPYISLCYNHVVINPENPPQGFECTRKEK
jgi:hypothetical protein